MEEINLLNLTDVQKTAIFTLIGRAKQSKSKKPILKDLVAEKVFESFSLKELESFKGGNPTHSVRAEYFDQKLNFIIQNNSEVTVISPGIGLETQFERLDNGQLYWYGLDFKEVIDLRENLMPDKTGRRTDLACSVMNPEWVEEIKIRGKVVIVCSGLFMYFEESQVLYLLKLFSKHFPQADIIFDAISKYASDTSLDRQLLEKLSGNKNYVMPSMPWGVDNVKGFLEEKARNIKVLDQVNGLTRHQFIYGISTGFKIFSPWFRKKYASYLVHAQFCCIK